MKTGDVVRTWWSQGHVSGQGFCYGKVVTAGPKTFVVKWQSGVRNRIRQDSREVTLVTDPELLAELEFSV